jgi:hypothetical protein
VFKNLDVRRQKEILKALHPHIHSTDSTNKSDNSKPKKVKLKRYADFLNEDKQETNVKQ